MTIVTYAGFLKRPNSTKVPSSGTSRTVTLKQATSVQNPTFILADSVDNLDNISAVSWDGRYYFVNNIQSNHNGITEISCSIDRGATYKSAILATNAFIERCAVGYDPDIPDPAYSDTYRTYIQTASSGDLFPGYPYSGYVCLLINSTKPSILAGGGVDAVFLNFTDVQSVLAKLWDSNVFANLKNVVGDAWNAIIGATYIPCFQAANLPSSFTSSALRLGDTDYSDVTVLRGPTGVLQGCYYTYSYEFDIDSIKKYNVFGWRNMAPHANWKLYLPFYGAVDVPIDEYMYNPAGAFLVIKATMDYTTGDLIYTRYKRVYTGGVAADYIMAKYVTKMGISIPLSNIKQGNYLETLSNITSGIGSAVAMDWGGAAESVVKGVTSAMQNSISTIGNASTGVTTPFAEFGMAKLQIKLFQIGHESNVAPDTYAATIGLPFMAQDTISNHTGFVKCNNAAVSMAGTQADKDAVNAMLNSGIFIE